MKRFWQGAVVALVAAALAVSMTACGKSKDKKEGAAEENEFAWIPEFVEVDMEKVGYSDVQIYGDKMYGIAYDWDAETMKSSQSLVGISLTDGEVKTEVLLKLPPIDDDGGGNRNINRFALDGEGNIWTVEEIYHWNETTGDSTREQYLCKYDSDGNLLKETDFTKEMGESSYVQNMALDGESRVYVAGGMGNSDIFLFDSEGVYKGKISGSSDMYIGSIGADKDGVMCAVVMDYGVGAGSRSLREIDFAQKAFGKSYANYPGDYSSGQLVPGVEKGTLSNDGSRVQEYDKESQTSQELFRWLDCDINGENVRALSVLPDGRIAVVIRDWESNRSDVALLTKTRASEVAQKETITIAGLYEDSSLQSAAVEFNKTNAKYRVTIKNYFDYDLVTSGNYQEVMEDALKRLNNDITSNNCPDILDLDQLNLVQLASKGVFEDLMPYLEKSSKLNPDDYLENILENFSYQGRLVTIPHSFELATVAGKTSEVGAVPGWTLEEMLAYADRNPQAAVFNNSIKTGILQFLITYNQSAFVDWETGTCSFDGETFKNLLRFADRFPDEYDWEADDRSEPTKIAAGEVLLHQAYLYNFESVQEAEGMFGEPVTFIGFPNNDGSSGCYMQTTGMLAIASKSDKKDGAWEFLESYLTADRTWRDFGFPVTKSELQEMVRKAVEVEYVLDENGDPWLDENGDPIISGGGGSVSYQDGWTYTYHKTTQEEADKLMDLIKTARPMTDSDMQIMTIITEETEAFFKGQKSVDDVAGIIQSRVQVYVNENR